MGSEEVGSHGVPRSSIEPNGFYVSIQDARFPENVKSIGFYSRTESRRGPKGTSQDANPLVRFGFPAFATSVFPFTILTFLAQHPSEKLPRFYVLHCR